jgi:RNA 2',3'-cyclic 3'-phosphodiesterase
MADGRYFFALWPDEAVRSRLLSVAKQAAAKGRLHHPEDIHLTLVFLGQVAAERQPCLQQVADSISGKAFELSIDHTGYWPRPKILWAGPAETPEPLSQLVSDLKHGLATCGFEPEQRRYQPHVTLYRKAMRVEVGEIDQPVPWRVSEFVLAVSSGGAPGEPRYRILRRWSLGGSDADSEVGAASRTISFGARNKPQTKV